MPAARIDMDLRDHGVTLGAVSRKLRGMDGAKVSHLFRQHLERAAQPYPRAVRAAVLAIPVKGKKHTGLRARIALCATVSSGEGSREGWVSVWMDPSKMRPDYVTLPLYMEGSKPRWRHPVYGNRQNWVDQAPHPYFRQAVAGLEDAARLELQAALDDISRQIS